MLNTLTVQETVRLTMTHQHDSGRFAPFSHAGRPHPLAKTASFPRCYGPEFVAADLRKWLGNVGTGTLYIEPGSPWENGYCESFNGKLRDECLNGEIFYSLKEAQIVIEKWRVEYNTRRPHSSLGYRPPAPAACSPLVPPNPSSQALAVM
jgi:IS30 family transposase